MSMTNVLVLDKMKEKNVVVLNVLSSEAFAKVHIPGSYNVPWGTDSKAFAKKVEQYFGREKFFITHCANVGCMAGPSAAKALKEIGLKAEDYPGGIEEWQQSGFPVEGTAVAQPAMK